ncbi:MAG: luciferase family oxidoreductase, partial [Acidiphilium sp. 21-68-69]
DPRTAHALRRNMEGTEARFIEDVIELQSYFQPAEPAQAVRAVPGAGLGVPVWLLGSSTFSADLAAALGLPFAFAAHFAPDLLGTALMRYRSRFQPSAQLPKPHAMVCLTVCAAPDDAEAAFLFTSQQRAFVNLRRSQPGLLPRPAPLDGVWSERERAGVEHALAYAMVGGPARVAAGLAGFMAEFRPDELMIACQIHDHALRRRSYEIVRELRGGLSKAA